MDRVCQFYLRGRCNRGNCEFKHEASSSSSNKSAAADDNNITSPKICRFYSSSNGTCRFGSNCRFSHEGGHTETSADKKGKGSDDDDEESILAGHSSDENESMISGFTDLDKKQQHEEEEEQEQMSALPKANNNVQEKETDPLSRGGPSTIKEGKKTVADLSREWSDDEEEEEAGTQGDDERDNDDYDEKDKKRDKDNTIADGTEGQQEEELDPLIQSSPTTNAADGGGDDTTASSQDAPQIISEWSSSLDDDDEGGTHNSSSSDKNTKEEWVTLIFGEDGKPSGEESKSNVYDLNPADTEMEKERGWPLRRRGGAKVRGGLRPSGMKREGGVTKIGNNMYFYTGSDDPKYLKSNSSGVGVEDHSMDSDSQMEESSEWISSMEEITPGGDIRGIENSSPSTPVVKQKRRTKKHKAHRTDYVYAGKSTAAKTRRCGECENCNKEDCNKCDACRDKPRNGGKGLKKQACIHRVCLWKNPSGKAHHVPGARPRGRPKTKTAPPGLIKATPPTTEEDNPQQQLSEEEKRKAGSSTGRLSLPVIAPGTTTTTTTNNNNNQHQKPKDSDLPEFDPDKFKPGYTPSVVKKGDSECVVVVTGVKDTGLCGKYWSNTDTLPSRRRASSAAVKSAEDQRGGGRQSGESAAPPNEDETTTTMPVKRTPGRKAKNDAKKATANISSKRKLKSDTKKNNISKEDKDEQEFEIDPLPNKKSRLDESALLLRGDNTSSTAEDNSVNNGNKSTAIRSVSCVADTSTQREVVVECFAPYDDHKWVNIGKERDNMKPDSVQYARALRPPYHLLSFLRIKGNSTKGMSCTDKNTMVFVVLEGEISVVLHTTQFNAKKGDSFYIPPKNYYNLINQKVREAELSLIQFQYDGPLPTVAASSQSGSAKV